MGRLALPEHVCCGHVALAADPHLDGSRDAAVRRSTSTPACVRIRMARSPRWSSSSRGNGRRVEATSRDQPAVRSSSRGVPSTGADRSASSSIASNRTQTPTHAERYPQAPAAAGVQRTPVIAPDPQPPTRGTAGHWWLQVEISRPFPALPSDRVANLDSRGLKLRRSMHRFPNTRRNNPSRGWWTPHAPGARAGDLIGSWSNKPD